MPATTNAALGTAPAAAAADAFTAEITAVIRGMGDALVRQDTDALGRLWADEHTFTTPAGKVLTKAQRLAYVGSPAGRIRDITYADVLVRAYGPVAVAVGGFEQTAATPGGDGGPDGRPHPDRGRFTSVFVRQERQDGAGQGGWRLVAQQNGPVAG